MFTFALVFYSLGASYVESFVNYRTWYFIGADEFKAYHQALRPAHHRFSGGTCLFDRFIFLCIDLAASTSGSTLEHGVVLCLDGLHHRNFDHSADTNSDPVVL